MVSGMIRMPEGVTPVIQTVKLSKLRLSEFNVRKSDDLNIDQLAADIGARGILQNLLVTPVTKPRGSFAVFDGGRRLRALNLRADRGEINPDDFDVPVMVLKGDDATLSETSLAANFHQLKMTPAEECRAFQHFLGTSGDIDAVAKRFGLTRRFVEGRLRLASLATPIFEALSANGITLDVAKAYASTENQEKQLLIWNAYSSYSNADTIRRAIANESMKANDAVALLVGEDRYVEAGGKVDRDLFSDGGDRWVNPEIAQRLAADIMEAEAKRIGEESGLAWIRPIASSYTHNAAAGLYRALLPQPDLTEEQSARLAEIEDRHAVIQSEMEDDELGDDAYQLLDQEYDRLAEEAQAIHQRVPFLPDEIKPLVGLFLTLTPKGEMLLDTQYYSEQPIRREAPAGEDGAVDGEEQGNRFSGGIRVGGDHAPAAPRPETVAPGGKPLSARLYDELAMQRRDILAACMLAHPALALDYALFTMIDDRNHHSVHYGTTIRARAPQDPMIGDMPTTRARDYLAEAHDGLDASWTEHKSEVDRFEAFRALDDDSKAAWLAYIVAMSLEAKAGYSNEQIPLQNRIASILEIDTAAWWRPTSENFFDRVSKGSILALLNDVGGAALTARHATLKKTDISVSCHKLFAGESIVEPEVKEAALAWVPDAMRFLDRQSEADPEFAPNADDVDDDTATVGDEAEDADATTDADLDPAATDDVTTQDDHEAVDA